MILNAKGKGEVEIRRLFQRIQNIINLDYVPYSGAISDLNLGSHDLIAQGITLNSLTASRILASNASKELVSINLSDWVAGTSNQITVTNDGDGTITLSTPQDIHTGASPTFLKMTLSQATGTAPLTISSTTKVSNLNVDLIDDVHVATLTNTKLLRYNSTGTQIESGTVVESLGALSAVTSIDASGYIYCDNFIKSAHYTGFPNRTDTSLSWDDGTYTLTLTATSDYVWINGKSFSTNTLTKQLTVGQEATSGLYWFWITESGGVLTLNVDIAQPTFDKCLVATVYWNTTTNKGALSDERHWMGRDQWTHAYLHETVGARYASGMAGTFTDTTITIAVGEFFDEDIEHTNTEQTTVKVLYHNGDADWVWDILTTPYKVVNPGVDNTMYYNNGNALATVDNNKYMNQWVFITADTVHPVHVVIGTAQYATIALARAASVPSLGSLTSAETKLIYKITYQNNGGSPDYIESTDYRSASTLPSTSYVSTDHGSLAGLSDDDHSQYVMANGSRPLTANWDMGAFVLTGLNFISDVATGTSPYACTSTTLNTNLNADLWDGYQFSDYLDQAVKTTSVVQHNAITAQVNDNKAVVSNIGIKLQNSTAALVGEPYQYPPAFYMEGHNYVSGSDRTMYTYLCHEAYSGGNQINLINYGYVGTGSAFSHPFALTFLSTQATSYATFHIWDSRTTDNFPFVLSNGAAATVSYNQTSPGIRFHSYGWKTDGGGASSRQVIGNWNDPETGVLSSIGVHKWVFGIETSTPNPANELMRFQWGTDAGITGTHFNKLALSDCGLYVWGLNGIDYNPGSDVDVDIYTVGVTGTPRMFWDESEDMFNSNKGWTITGNVYPGTDNTYYLGKNDDDTPLAYKGIILKDQAGTGKYYRVEIYNNALQITDLTD